MVAFGIVFIIGSTAVVVDWGLAMMREIEAQNAADAGAVAGTLALADGGSAWAGAANELIGANDLNSGAATATLASSFSANDTVAVDITDSVPTVFGSILGIARLDIHAHAAALAVGGTNLQPFGLLVYDDDFDLNYTVGSSYQLKVGNGGNYDGNFLALALNGTGAAVYEENIVNGSTTTLCAGMMIDTEPGNMVGPTS